MLSLVSCVMLTLHYSETYSRLCQIRSRQSEGCQTMRLPGVRGECRGPRHQETFEVSAVPVSDLLLHGPRLAAFRRPRESLRRAAADLRLPRVRGASRDLVLRVWRGGVLLRPEAHAEAQGDARECVPGAVLAALSAAELLLASKSQPTDSERRKL